MITMIAAVDKNWGLGNKGELLAMVPEDMAHFKKITMGKTVVMGRKTWQSLPMRLEEEGELPTRGLKGRKNIIISRAKCMFTGADMIARDIETILELAKTEDIFIIGGGSIYKQFYQYADVIELTVFMKEYKEVDVFFPKIKAEDFIDQNSHVQEKNEDRDFDLRFITFVRRK